jgi:hypothetical protein
MADDPHQSDDRYDPSVVHIEERQALRLTWARDRAKWVLQLIALLPADQQAEGLRLWGELERAHGCHTDDIQTAWRGEVERAYQAGQQRAYGTLKITEDVAVAPAPNDPDDPDPAIVH